jgi:folylpolyglutamate synthase/dihydrofolate synthase
MHRLLARLGNPHAALPAVHVVGSKGKGSTGAMLAAAAAAAGYRVGLYASPHVTTLRERVRVGGVPISRADLDALAARAAPALAAAAAEEAGALSTFEAMTALALRHFADAGVELAVLEAGLGGAADATNVFGPDSAAGRPPVACVVTPITLEHVAALGGSLASVAAAKAGVFCAGTPAIVAAQPHAEAAAVLAAAAGDDYVDVGACVGVDGVELERAEAGAAPRTRVTLTLRPPLLPTTLTPSLALYGAHQAANAAAAAAAAAVLAGKGFPRLTPAATVAGLEAAALPARFQTVQWRVDEGSSNAIPVVLDGAHTPESAAALAAALRAAHPLPARLAFVLACAADKDAAGIARALKGASPVAVVITEAAVAGSTARCAAPGALVAAWELATPPPGAAARSRVMVKAGVRGALDAAVREAGAGGVVCVTGSLHAAGEAARVVCAAV